MTIELTDLIGYVLAVISIFIALILQSRASRESDALKHDLKSAISERQEDQKSHEKTLETINEVAFNALIRVKNFPSDANGMSAQREAFYSSLDAIGKITSSASKLRALKGEFIFGSDLGFIEKSDQCKEVALFSPDLKPDIDEPDLLADVVRNANSGTDYSFIVPFDTDESLISSFKDALDAHFQKMNSTNENIRVVRAPDMSSKDVFWGGSRALYLTTDDAELSVGLSKVAFSEIVIPDEKRGALWRRVSQSDVQRLFDILCSTKEEPRRLPLPEGDERDEEAVQVEDNQPT